METAPAMRRKSPDAPNDTAGIHGPAATEEDGGCVYFNACDLEADAVVEASPFDFDLGILTLDVGATVVWVNVGGLHNVNATTNQLTGLPFDNPQPFNIPAVLGSPEGTCLGSFTFTVPGVYNYNSVSNQAQLGMIGTIIIGNGGCTDDEATNYDAAAEFDDDSCVYSGCLDALASNYDPLATIDDGSCLYPGCTNLDAANYDAGANDDDGSCLLSVALIPTPTTSTPRPTPMTVPAPTPGARTPRPATTTPTPTPTTDPVRMPWPPGASTTWTAPAPASTTAMATGVRRGRAGRLHGHDRL